MMLNFALSLLFAFLLLVIIQRYPEIQEENTTACFAIGHLNIFFFLATFVWMTIMSYVIFDQIHGCVFCQALLEISRVVLPC